MSAKTFEEWFAETGMHPFARDAAMFGWTSSRAALLAERPDVARIIGELRNWADEDRPGPLSHFRRKEEKAAAAIESLAAQNAAQAKEIAKLKGHAEAMAVEIRASYWGGNPSTALAAYRLDYPEES